MSKKYYILLANALAATRPPVHKQWERYRWVRVRDELCTQLTRDNPRFDTVKFIDKTEQ